MSMNSVSISGNLTRDCELRTTQNGTQILTFTVAVNDRKKDQNGKWVDVPNYIDCCIFGNRAESVSRFISKGSKVSCHGKLRYSSWEKDGNKRSKLEVIVDEIEFMSKRESQPQNQPQQQQVNNYPSQYQSGSNSAPQQPQTGYQQGVYDDLADDSIPF